MGNAVPYTEDSSHARDKKGYLVVEAGPPQRIVQKIDTDLNRETPKDVLEQRQNLLRLTPVVKRKTKRERVVEVSSVFS
jgi:hypothetical protein